MIIEPKVLEEDVVESVARGDPSARVPRHHLAQEPDASLIVNTLYVQKGNF